MSKFTRVATLGAYGGLATAAGAAAADRPVAGAAVVLVLGLVACPFGLALRRRHARTSTVVTAGRPARPARRARPNDSS